MISHLFLEIKIQLHKKSNYLFKLLQSDKYIQLKNDIQENCFLEFNISNLREILYCYENNILEQVHCDNPDCLNFVRFNRTGYNKVCSVKCVAKSTAVINKKLETLSKEGITNISQRQTVKDKKACKFDPNFLQEKIKEKSLEKHGTLHHFSSKDVKEKIRCTNLERYGVDNPNQNSAIKNKIRETREFSYIEYIDDNFNFSILEKNERKENSLFRCNICNSTFTDYIHNSIGGQNINCPICNPDNTKENEIRMFSNSIKTRTVIPPLELDCFNDKFMFAIEYNGLMFHSEGNSKYAKFSNIPKNYHLNKTELCEDKNIQLFHIFENEWLDKNKKDIWKSVINCKMGISKRIFARKCKIKEVSSNTARLFEESNHLQGSGKSAIKLGLYFEDILISLMTFGKSRFSKQYEYELIRYCSIKNTIVVGGASKLLKYFELNYKPKSLVSYANRRWSVGNVYETLGFTFSHNSTPNYFYFKERSLILESRNKFQKHKLNSKLDAFDENLSETVNMFNNGYRKIFDSGNKVYFKIY